MRRRDDFATFVDLLRTRAQETPDGLAYVFLQDGEEEAERLTFAELDARARSLAAWLQRRQPAGERALLLYPPGLDLVAAFFGCLYAGAVAVPSYPPAPVRPGRDQPRLRSIVEDSAPRFVLTSAGLAPRLDALAGDMPSLGAAERLVTDQAPAGLADDWSPPATPGITADTIAFLQYTSGSTSDPKGVMVSHGNLLHNEEVIRSACGHDERSTFVSWLPMYHDMGLIGGVLQPLYTGAACVLMAPVAFLQRPVRWLRAISHWRAHTSGAPDFAYDLCVRKIPPEQRADLDLSSWRIAFDGSEPVRARTLAAFTEAFSPHGFRSSAFFPCYGLAEATLIVSGEARAEGPMVEPDRQRVACGPVGLGLDVAIVDPERLEPVLPGAEGEVWVTGPSVARGYWNKPELSESTFGARLAGREERFLRTGDLGFQRDGRLFVTGRLKDLIIVRGRNHYPQDLELTVADSHPALLGGAGAAFASETEHGEAVVVVQEVDVRRRPDAETLEEILGTVRQALAEEHELPVQAVVLVRLGGVPKTTSGKVQRALCKRRFLEGLLEPLAEWRASAAESALPEIADDRLDSPESRAAWLRRRVAAKLGLDEKDIDPAAPLTRYGLDSLAAVELAHEIETGLGVEVPLTALLEGRSLEELDLSRVEGERVEEEAGGEALSAGERALWFLQRLDPASPAYHIAGAGRIAGQVDEEALRNTFQQLVDRHPALRTTFSVRDGEPVRRVHPEAVADFAIEDAAAWSPQELAERVDAEIFRPFDLEAGPLLRVRILRRGPEERILVLTIHHIVADFWSLALMLRDLGSEGVDPKVAEGLAPSRAGGGVEGVNPFAFWQERLAGFPLVLDLPLDYQRRAWPAHRAASVPFALQEGTAETLRALGRERGATLFTVLLATFQTLLHRVTGEERLLVGAPTAGRSRVALAEQVGYFVNPVVLPSEAVDDPSFAALLDAARRTVLAAFAHEVPFPQLVERLQPERDPGRTPLFQVAFVLQKAPRKEEEGLAGFALNQTGSRLRLGALDLESVSLPHLPGQFDLTLVAAEIEGTIHLSFFYDVELFDRTTLLRLADHLRHLAAAVAARPDLRLSEVSLWSEAERWQVVGEWNDTAAPTSSVLIHERVAARAAAAPEAVAIRHGERTWAYRELTRRAWGLAWRLRALGVGPEVRVAVLTERRPEMVVASLAVLAAGGAYVPLDPMAPPERLARLVRDSGARVLLTEREPGRGLLALPEIGATTVVMEEVLETAEEPPVVRTGRQNLAYIMYTSGSTGEPKGVETEHAAMVDFVDGYIAETNLGPVDVSGQLSGLAFDGSVMDMWPSLTVGGSVRLPDEETRVTPERLRDWMVAEGITLCFLPTPLFEAMLGLAWPAPGEGRTPRLLLVGGARLRLRPEPDLPFTLVNVYGPTETTVLATGGRVTPAGVPGCPERMPALGRPMPAMRIYLLDARLRPVPVGSPGELCLTGGLARGYLGQSVQTAERFLPNPFGLPGTRLYRSGDLARWLPDGKLEFLGRTDHQVKVRGFRIEPGEIERTLTQHPAVREALVLAAADDAGGDGAQRLIAFVAPSLEGAVEPAALRTYLTTKLPQFMIPSVFVILPGLPRTVNGKIDRQALVVMAAHAGGAETEAAAPRDPLEEVLAGLWAEVLGVSRVGIHDDFFALGGHSLLGARLISRIHTVCGFEVPLRTLFEAPTVARLAEALSAEGTVRRGREAIPRVSRESAALPLSFGQERLWFLDRLQPGGAAYNVPLDLRFTGRLSVSALAASLGEIVRRHEALRTSFPEIDGRPVQEIHSPAAFVLPSIDLAGLPADAAAGEADRFALDAARHPFDLERGPLVRALLLRCGVREHRLLLVLHHIVSDGASLQVLLTELADGLSGRPSRLADLAVQPADVAAWERTALTDESLVPGLAFWAEQLTGAPALDLPSDLTRPAMQTERGGLRGLELSPEVASGLSALARQEGVTPFMLFLAAFEVLLARWSGQDDFVIGTPVAHRGRPELEPLIGLLVGSVALRVPLAGDPAGRELLGRVRRVTLEAFHHAGVPFEKIVERLQPERSLSRNPIFQTLFTLQPEVLSHLELPELTVVVRAIENGTAKFDLSLFVRESQGAWIVTLEHSLDLFEPPTADRLLGGFARLLAGLVAAPESRISELPLLSGSERSQLLAWSRGPEPEPAAIANTTLHGLVAAQAARTPEAVAVIWQTERLTYRQLWERVESLAGRLRELGAGAETVIGVRLPRTPDLIVALLAVLESGAAYLPLDPAYPEERLAFLVEDAGTGLVIGDGVVQASGGPLPLTPSPVRATTRPPRTGEGEAAGGSLAYIIYTSGSTGRPKGVAIEHGSAVRLVAWAGATFTQDELAGVLASTSVSFDLSVFEIFVPLAWGGTVILADDALALPSLPAAGEVTLINTVPSAMAGLLELLGGPVAPTVCLAGESLRHNLVDRIYAAGAHRVFNLYGPSEDTTYSTGALIGRDETEEPTIGGPVAGSRAYVVDGALGLVPSGVAGELCLGGGGLARGYLGRPELTAERFVPDPFGVTAGRLYRTGDRIRRRADGSLVYLGRFDHQVKIRGFRIEPGEIETALLSLAGVAATAVVPAPGGDRLAAFAVARPGEALDGGSLREALRGRLPAQLVPASVTVLGALPLTPNGKVDRAALVRLADQGKGSGERFVPPRGPVEEMLAGLFAELLGGDRGEQIGAHDDFFALGGHSLLATRVVSRVRAVLGVELQLRAVFEAPTVAGLAARVEAARHAISDLQEPLIPVPRSGDLPLSFAQQRLWFLHRLDPASPAYHIPSALHLAGRLDLAALTMTLQRVTERHEALRTTFTLSGEEPVQRLGAIAAAPDLRLPLVDLSALAEKLRRGEADRIAVAEGRRPFDLQSGPLMRALLVRLAADEHILAVCFHHIIADGWSFGVLLREIAALYPPLAAGERPSPLPALPVQVADFAVWQRRWLRGDALRSRLAWWEERLAGGEAVLDLPTDRPRPARPPERGRTFRFRLGAERTAAIDAAARREGATPFMVLLAVWQAFLHRITGQDDISVGSPIANRNRAETEGLIGYFVNTLVLRTLLRGDEGFRALLGRVRETALGAYDHQDLPFELLVEALRPGRDAALAPLTQVLFVLQNAPRPNLELPGLRLALLPVDIGAPKLDLAFSLERQGDELAAALEYPLELFDPPTLERWAGSFDCLLAGSLADPNLPLSRLPLLGAAELHQIVAEWNPVPELIPEGSPLLHERIATWVARTPEAPAVSYEGETLTYRELDRRANQLAHHLLAAGIVPGARVGLWLERSVDVIVGIFGILKAGAAWVPLDPNYPLARLAAMAQDAGLGALVTSESLAVALGALHDQNGALPSSTVRVLLDADRAAIERRPDTPLDIPLPGNALAYVIYTSGSMGRPKGVACHHAGVINLIADLARWPLPPGSAGSLFASVSFDVSIYEIFSMLLNGGRLEVAPERVRGSGRLYGEWLREHPLENVFVPPPMLADLRDVMAEGGVRMRRLLVGIEPIAEPFLAALTELSPGLVVLNGYGPTETTVVVSEYPVTGHAAAERHDRNDRTTPIGRPVLNMRVYLLDRELDPVPVGVPGELYAAGCQVSWGYLGRPDLTAERFLPDPLAESPGERMYRTGDLVRWLPDGHLSFIGRADRQVKIRGVRVEPGEIEAVLRGAPGVRDCLVAPRLDARGERRLVAWVVGKPDIDLRGDLRDHLRARLPEVMVPAAFVHLDALPLTTNGKIDRAALADPDWQRPELLGERVAPRTPVEEIIAEIWQELLGVEAIGIHDSFFDLGGHSLKAGQLVLRVRDQLGVELPVRTVFEAPTVAEMAVAIGRQLVAETDPDLVAQILAGI